MLLVHRLRFLLPVPGLDPLPNVHVYDFDDALFLGSIASANSRFAFLKREPQRWRAYVQRARLVLAGNAYLAEHASRHARRVEVVPSCVDPSVVPPRSHEEREVLTAGWVGSASTVRHLTRLIPIFERLNSQGLRLRLVVMGGDPGVRRDWLELRSWSENDERELLRRIDIGLMPLPNDEWSRGKCGYKLLLYGAAGLPVVASPVGVNRFIAGEGRGLLVESEAEWIEALGALGDVAVRKEMGAAARRFVEREYSYEVWAPRIAELLRSVG